MSMARTRRPTDDTDETKSVSNMGGPAVVAANNKAVGGTLAPFYPPMRWVSGPS